MVMPAPNWSRYCPIRSRLRASRTAYVVPSASASLPPSETTRACTTRNAIRTSPTVGKAHVASNATPGTRNLFRRLVTSRIPVREISAIRKWMKSLYFTALGVTPVGTYWAPQAHREDARFSDADVDDASSGAQRSAITSRPRSSRTPTTGTRRSVVSLAPTRSVRSSASPTEMAPSAGARTISAARGEMRQTCAATSAPPGARTRATTGTPTRTSAGVTAPWIGSRPSSRARQAIAPSTVGVAPVRGGVPAGPDCESASGVAAVALLGPIPTSSSAPHTPERSSARVRACIHLRYIVVPQKGIRVP